MRAHAQMCVQGCGAGRLGVVTARVGARLWLCVEAVVWLCRGLLLSVSVCVKREQV